MRCLNESVFQSASMRNHISILLFCIFAFACAIEGVSSVKWVELNDTTFFSALASHNEMDDLFFC